MSEPILLALPINPNDLPPAREITITYMAPVHVVVSRDDHGEWRIDKVVVDDESTDFSPDAGRAFDSEGVALAPDDPDLAAAKAAVAAGEDEWPG